MPRLVSAARHYATRVQVLLTQGQPHVFELWATGTAAIWAITLILPANTLGSSPGFRVLAGVGLSEEAIAALFGLLAVAQGAAVIRDDVVGRIGAAYGGWALWAFLGATLAGGNPVAPAGWLYLWLALGQLWTAIRLGRARPWTRRSRS